MKKAKPTMDHTRQVNEFMDKLDYPFKAEVQMIREIIRKVKSKLLEGNYDDRRMAYFADKKDKEAKKTALEKALKDLIKLQNKSAENV
jgi:hypothetical protein